MTNSQKESVLALLTKKISEPEFFQSYGVAPESMPGEILRALDAAEAERNRESMQFAMMLTARFSATISDSEMLSRFNRLIAHDWHESHEEMLRYLQRAASPASIAPVRDAIALKPALAYLDYDDYGAFYKKCLWVLQAIGTDEAIAAIADYADADDPALRAEAMHSMERAKEREFPQ